MKDRLYQLQSRQLTRHLAIRARQERALVKSIQTLLHKRPDIILRRPEKRKGFYLGNAADFERKAMKYMTDTEAYGEILKRRAINQDQHKMMLHKSDTLELTHLHFIPKVHHHDQSLLPSTDQRRNFPVSRQAPAAHILESCSKDDLHQSIRALEKHASEDRLSRTALFVTFDVADLYTMIPRQGALEALMRFFVQQLYRGRMGTLLIKDIMRVARLLLDTNYFAYKDKFYLQIRGGSMGSVFTCWNGNSP